jgi:hypothetical protein
MEGDNMLGYMLNSSTTLYVADELYGKIDWIR